MQSRSAHSPGWRAQPCSRCSSPFATFWGPCLTRPALRGLFAPMLVLGAQLGGLFAILCQSVLPHFEASSTALAVVGMAAFFAAVVRAPVTGIVLITELTAGFTQLIPMLWACFAAMVISSLFGSKPIYDSLSEPKYLLREKSGEP